MYDVKATQNTLLPLCMFKTCTLTCRKCSYHKNTCSKCTDYGQILSRELRYVKYRKHTVLGLTLDENLKFSCSNLLTLYELNYHVGVNQRTIMDQVDIRNYYVRKQLDGNPQCIYTNIRLVKVIVICEVAVAEIQINTH